MESTLEKKDLIQTREYTALDRNFILATWLRGLYYGDEYFSDVPKSIFMETYHLVLEKFLVKAGVNIKIACLKEDPEVILGYSVSRRVKLGEADLGVIDWVFVKAAWRKIGIGKMLVPSRTNAYTHVTKTGKSIVKSKYPDLTFNPFLFNR